MCQSDVRGKDLCDEVIIILIFSLSPLDRYVTSHLLQEQQSPVHAEQICMHSSHPSLLETQLQPWIYPCASAVKSEENMKQILERLCRGLHRDPMTPARLLVFGYVMDTFVCCRPLFSCSFILQKKINNRFTSHASDRGLAQHCLLAT